MKNPDPIYFDDESRTIQSDYPKTRITNILRQYQQNGGIVTHLNNAQASYRDISDFTDLKDALVQARDAEAAFMRLPSLVREQFNHDVAVWLDTAHDMPKREALLAETKTPVEPEELLPSGDQE